MKVLNPNELIAAGENHISVRDDYLETWSYDANGNILKALRHEDGNNGFEMDNFYYNYYSGTDQLEFVSDAVHPSNYAIDIDDQTEGNYRYDAIGNLIADDQEQIDKIEWTVYGKIASVSKMQGAGGIVGLYYDYDASGNRISKLVSKNFGHSDYTWYVRDAQCNVMAVYEEKYAGELGSVPFTLTEQHIYGSSRVGVLRQALEMRVEAEQVKEV